MTGISYRWRERGGRALALLLATPLALLPATGLAAEPPLPRAQRPGLGAEDPRRPVTAEEAPWTGLARVQTTLGGRCTGALVGPRLVLTAAHCLAARTGRWVRPGSVHVLVGYHLGEWALHARVEAFETGAAAPASGAPGGDWALLRLDRDLAGPERVLPLLRDPPPRGAPAMLGGYQQDRAERLMADTDCRLLGPARDATGRPLLRHGCSGTRGSSGAPLLTRDGEGRWAVAGVVVMAEARRAGGIAVPVGAIGPLR